MVNVTKPRSHMFEGMAQCTNCALRRSAKRVVPGFGIAPNKVMLVAQSPGADEDYLGRPLIGKSGKFLRKILAEIGWDLDQLYATNVNLCHPPGNRAANKGEINACHNWLALQVAHVDPDVIIPLGATAYKEFMPDEPGSITNIRGNIFRENIFGRDRWIIPTIHPAFADRNPTHWRPILKEDLAKAKLVADGEYVAPLGFRKDAASWKEILEVVNGDLDYGFDLETDSLDRHTKIIGVGVCNTPGNGLYFPFIGDDEASELMQELKPSLESTDLTKFVTNAKFERHACEGPDYKITVRNYADTLLMAWLLGDMPIGLKDGIHAAEGIQMIRIDKFKKMVRDDGKVGYKSKDRFGDYQLDMRWAQEERLAEVVEYAAQDPDATLRLHTYIKKRIDNDPPIKALLADPEMPFLENCITMERNGMPFWPALLDEPRAKLNNAYDDILQELAELATVEFKPNSNADVPALLYGWAPGPETKATPSVVRARELAKIEHSYRIPTPRWSPAKRNGPPADKIILGAYLDNPLVRGILTARATQKLVSYTNLLPKFKESGELWPGGDGRIHSDIRFTGTTTGRVATADPNLTNIPARDREDVDLPVHGKELRLPFMVEDPTTEFIYAPDLSQIEMRMAAHLSGDANMIHQLTVPGGDIHSNSAQNMYQTSLADLQERFGEDAGLEDWKNKRYTAKTVGFGTLYLLTAHGLILRTPTLKLSIQEAQRLIDGFYTAYPDLRVLQRETIAFTRANGYAETILGRRRYLPDVLADDKQIRGEAERSAVNVPIQGSAADFFKLAVNAVSNKLAELNLLTYLCGQVHDEIIMQGPQHELNILRTEVVPLMGTVMKLKVPVNVDFEYGTSWGDLKKWEPVAA